MDMGEPSSGSDCDPVLLNSFIVKKQRCRVYFHRGVLIWESEGAPYIRVKLPLKNVVGVEYEHPSELSAFTNEIICQGDSPEEYTSFTLHYVTQSKSSKLRLSQVTLTHADPRQVASWVKTIRNYIKELTYRPRCLLLFVNPYGGKKRGQKIYEKKVKPLLARAGIETKVVITQYRNHAHETILSHSFDGIDGVVCIGGDGTVAEVLNALVLRAAKEKGIDTDDPNVELPQPSVAVGVIPGGSTDTIAYSLHGTNDIQTAVLHVIIGESTGLDICSVHNESRLLRYYASMLSYGYLGDVCKSSEKFRWMGPKRYDYSGFRKILANRGYRSEITILSTDRNSPADGPRCYRNCDTCKVEESSIEEKPAADWKTVRGRFFMVNGVNISCACAKAPNGFSPYCHIGDGCLDVILIKHTSMINILRLLLRISSKSRTMFDLPFVEVHRAQEFTLQAMPDPQLELLDPDAPDARTSVWNCDGEVIEGTNIKIRVRRQLIRMFSQRMEEEEQEPSCLGCK
ncbi:Ceramide kinase [Frankliniella fusca]|uniref:Ceramide kinase n=1 Tax=Frankliniella fusca TaxID=407009 RepID=A0AAE1GWC9_9NEOP|nr:Ceramide kinase [Frankliniella fusca]